jgi:hypothetical protein
MTTATMVMLRLDQIDRDPNSLQMRSNIANLDPVVDHYATLMEDGVEFPPLTIIQEGEKFWCADGNLRWLAVSKNAIERNGPKEILCQISQGTHRDAVLLALRANHAHGQRRTPADLRRIVQRALQDEELAKLPSRELAAACGVSHNFVCTVKRELEAAEPPPPPKSRRNGDAQPINVDEIRRASWQEGHRAGRADMLADILHILRESDEEDLAALIEDMTADQQPAEDESHPE